MISKGGSMKCGRRCENVKFQMGDYSLNTHMFSIEMGSPIKQYYQLAENFTEFLFFGGHV